LAFATRAVDAPHRIETPTRLLFRGVPVRAVRESRPTRRSTSTSRTPLMGFIDRPSADTTVAASTPAWAVAQASVRDCHIPNVFRSCRSSRLQRFPPQRADPKTRPFDSLRVCCTPQPAMGFTTFRTPWSASRPSLDPKVVDLTVQGESSPVANTLRSVPLLDSLRPCRHRVSSFRTRPRTPAGVPSRRFEPCSLPCRHGALLCSPTSGLSSVEESVAAARRFRCAPARCSLGLWIDSFPILPRVSRRPDVLDVSPCGPAASASPTRTSGEGKVFRPCLAPCDRRSAFPEGRTVCGRGGSGTSRRRHLGRIPHGPRRNRWDASGSAPRGGSTASVERPKARGADVIATHLRRDSCATQCSLRRTAPVVRARAPHPSAVARVHDEETARRQRPHPEAWSFARHSRAPRRMLRRTHRPESRRTPTEWASRRTPGGVPWRLVAPAYSSKLESRSRARQSS
jgi:hypothetical protein